MKLLFLHSPKSRTLLSIVRNGALVFSLPESFSVEDMACQGKVSDLCFRRQNTNEGPDIDFALFENENP